jgi:CDP-2,3-bis-(O-geranylgeranyl)-sn-glycerol synthase
MLQDILFAFWFLLPAAAANAAPIFAAAIPVLKRFDAPIDAHHKFRGHRIFGSHKTWRGIIAGIIVASFVLWLQQVMFIYFGWAQYLAGQVDYAQLSLLLGPMFAIGALGGDAIESFFKRQHNVRSGGSWIPFDQIDYIIGAVLISLFFVRLHPLDYFWIFVIWFLAHIVGSYVGYRLGLKKEPI